MCVTGKMESVSRSLVKYPCEHPLPTMEIILLHAGEIWREEGVSGTGGR